jgi:hypothetical protein
MRLISYSGDSIKAIEKKLNNLPSTKPLQYGEAVVDSYMGALKQYDQYIQSIIPTLVSQLQSMENKINDNGFK